MKLFYDRMTREYAGKDAVGSDPAEDMERSGNFARINDREAILANLRRRNACPECAAVFKRCWGDYARECG